jgi:S-adenosylmethionine hydrolase
MTDFGLADVYVGQMKGVIDKINPNVKVIDLTHDVQPFNVRQAGFILKNSYKYFCQGTIFICVVDPEVGSGRESICIETEDYLFLAPNNGLLTYLLDELRINQIIKIDNLKYNANEVSNTFHGRDVFAVAGGYLSKGIKLEEIGSSFDISLVKKSESLMVRKFANKVVGEIVYSDRFGNIVTSIHRKDLPKEYEKLEIRINEFELQKICKTFSDVKVGELLAYIGSMEYLEIAVREGRASDLFRVETSIKLIWE